MVSFKEILNKELSTTSQQDAETYQKLDNSVYKEKVIGLINKALADEITAASLYLAMAQNTTSQSIATQLEEHSLQEFGHYTKLIQFAFNHGLEQDIVFSFSDQAANDVPYDDVEILELVQTLELEAIQDYKTITLIARENEDYETEEFFGDIMEDEMGHFDDLNRYLKQKRQLGN